MSRSYVLSRFRWCLGALASGMLGTALAGSPQPNFKGPAIQFAAPLYDFGKAMSGDIVEHVFEFTNTGNATLEILGVYPSCNCTTPGDWTRQVAPGGTGRVALRFDTTRFEGSVTEATTVANNDRAHFNVALQIKGTVWKPVEVNPRTVILKPVLAAAAGDANMTRIINHLPEPMTLEEPVSDNAIFTAELKTMVPGREFQLTVHTGPAHHPPMVQGTISIKTSSVRVPLIRVAVLAMPQAALSVSPTLVRLPANPLSVSFAATVSLRNQGKSLLKLTSAKVDVPGAEVRIKELQPGREFELTLTFPAGFELPRNREPALTILTSNPETPSITVPLRQSQPVVANPAAPRNPAFSGPLAVP